MRGVEVMDGSYFRWGSHPSLGCTEGEQAMVRQRRSLWMKGTASPMAWGQKPAWQTQTF